MHTYDKLIDNADLFFEFRNKDNESLERLKELVEDSEYINFITDKCNGGYFYDRSLQLYSLSDTYDYNNIFIINDLLKEEYKGIIKDDFFFAEDVFGNQFGFSHEGVVFFNIETGEREIIGIDFLAWNYAIVEDVQYYTGQGIIEDWNNQHGQLSYNMRLYPTKPFVVGGEYEISNLTGQHFPVYISSYANIARQVYNLPDGVPIKLTINP